MQNMITFTTSMLTAIAQFLRTEPIFYIFGLICFLFIVKAFKILIQSKI